MAAEHHVTRLGLDRPYAHRSVSARGQKVAALGTEYGAGQVSLVPTKRRNPFTALGIPDEGDAGMSGGDQSLVGAEDGAPQRTRDIHQPANALACAGVVDLSGPVLVDEASFLAGAQRDEAPGQAGPDGHS